MISIHALLAESDLLGRDDDMTQLEFLSTLSLRRATGCRCPPRHWHGGFLSTLSLRRATIEEVSKYVVKDYFYPRSPCGERLGGGNTMNIDVTISIHALLAESDYSMGRNEKSFRGYFYPRSPCGERLRGWTLNINGPIFLSTLSLRRATPTQQRKTKTNEFLSTLSLRRATG